MDEILDAALIVIDKMGYPAATMEAIVKHTSLSKGGVYRFFSNKKDVTLALFEHISSCFVEFDQDEVLSWKLPLVDTMVRINLNYRGMRDQNPGNYRVYLQLLAQIFTDDDFRTLNHRLEEKYTDKYRQLILALIQRDKLPVGPDFEKKLEQVILIGHAYLHGLFYLAHTRMQDDEVEDQLHWFLNMIVENVLQTA